MVSFSLQLRGIFHKISSLITMLLLPVLALGGCTRWSLPAVALSHCEKPRQWEEAEEEDAVCVFPLNWGSGGPEGGAFASSVPQLIPGINDRAILAKHPLRICIVMIPSLSWDKHCFLLVFLLLLFQRQLKHKWLSFSNVFLIRTSLLWKALK